MSLLALLWDDPATPDLSALGVVLFVLFVIVAMVWNAVEWIRGKFK